MAEIAITQLAPFSAAMLERMPALKLIVVARGGPVNIDLNAARKRGVLIVNAPGRNASAVAEFTIGAIIAETRLMTRGHDALRRGEWRGDLYRSDLVGRELSQMTVGVIGYGHIGTKVVRLLKAFGGRILVADPYVTLSARGRARRRGPDDARGAASGKRRRHPARARDRRRRMQASSAVTRACRSSAPLIWSQRHKSRLDHAVARVFFREGDVWVGDQNAPI